MSGPGAARRELCYCTNVHPGATLEAARDALDVHATAVRAQVCPAETLGLGLWLAAPAARALRDEDGAVAAFGAWLAERGLRVVTINGFPSGDFHGDVVRHAVYEPPWWDERRAAFTLDLAAVLARLLPEGAEGSISTLPLGWGAATGPRERAAAAGALHAVADALADLEARTGRCIHLDLEPEPGCALSTAAEMAAFFDAHLLTGPGAERRRRHLRACHDVCHAAVMFEAQRVAFAAYDAAGVNIGKVQLSSAVEAPLDAVPPGERAGILAELAAFREPRYLHQTCVRGADGAVRFFEDLPEALAAAGAEPAAARWRTHFHVPVDLATIGRLRTTRGELETCLRLLANRDDARHLEVETYAWDVLPAPLRVPRLADGIARELRWVRSALAAAGVERR